MPGEIVEIDKMHEQSGELVRSPFQIVDPAPVFIHPHETGDGLGHIVLRGRNPELSSGAFQGFQFDDGKAMRHFDKEIGA